MPVYAAKNGTNYGKVMFIRLVSIAHVGEIIREREIPILKLRRVELGVREIIPNNEKIGLLL